ncbi:hypothetical protein D3C84_1121710 [compost metagenome]
MALQLQHILAGKRVGRRKEQRQSLIDHLRVIREKWPVVGVARPELSLADGLGQRPSQGAGDTHDANAATTLGGGDGGDGFAGCRHAGLRMRLSKTPLKRGV